MHKISVVILTHERLQELKECLGSIFMQEYKNYEIILMDDSLDDNTEKYMKQIKDERIIYEHKPSDADMGEKRKIAYRKASGDYVIFIDDDDYLIDKKYFSTLAKCFETNDQVDVVLSDTNDFFSKTGQTKIHALNLPQFLDAKEYFRGFGIKYKKPRSTLGFAARKEVLDEAGFQNMFMMNDTLIYLRSMLTAKLICYNNNVVANYRIHKKNYSKTVDADLILKQLKGKKQVYREGKKYLRYPRKIWLYRQVLITAKYFAEGKGSNKAGTKDVMRYIRKDIGLLPYIRMCQFFLEKKHANR